MATFSGFKSPNGTSGLFPVMPDGWTGDHPRPAETQGLLDRDVGKLGSFTVTQPISEISQSFGGYRARTYFEDYYDRIYFIPNPLNLGWVTVPVSSTVTIWNAFLRARTIESIAEFDGEGVSLGGITIPTTMAPLATKTFSVAALPDGPPTIATSYNFTFDGDDLYILRVTGIRSTLWDFGPNWKDGFSIVYEYKTDISTSRNGKEQRRALRQTPRRSLSFKSLIQQARWRRFVRYMARRKQNSFVVPEYTRFAKLTADVEAGDLNFALDARPEWIAAGETVILVSGERCEILTVDGVSGNNFTSIAAVAADWPAGSKVCAALSGRLDNTLGGQQNLNDVGTLSVEFNVAPGIDTYLPPPAADLIYAGREVFMQRPNWAQAISPKFESYTEMVDYGFGRTYAINPVPFTSRYHEATYLGRDTAGANALVALFDRMKGQQGEFYMPTWTDDVRPKIDINPNSNNMRVEGTDFTEYANDTIYRKLAFFLRDGSVLFRSIDTIYDINDVDGHDTIVEFIETFPDGLHLDQVKMISWLPLWRFATDGFTMQWVTDQVAQAVITLRSLEDLESE